MLAVASRRSDVTEKDVKSCERDGAAMKARA
jgi:hypothetical protein